MARILRQHAFGGPGNLHLDDLPTVAPGPGEVRLRVQAVGLTRDQLPFLDGNDYGGGAQPMLPTRFGYEAAGIVEAVGEGVDASWVGVRVAPVGPFDQERYGCAGDEAIVPAELLIRYPDRLTPAQAAALWVPYLTAYAIVQIGGVREGEYVSLPAGNSAVALAATQIARDAGAFPIAVVRSAAKAAGLRERGAHDVIVTATEDYVARITEITDGQGVRVTFDPIGGDFLAPAAEAAAVGGTIIEYGVLGGVQGRFPVEQVIGKGLTIRGFAVSEVVFDPAARESATRYVLDRVERGTFVPQVARTFPLEQALDAFAYIASGPDPGRVVLLTEPDA